MVVQFGLPLFATILFMLALRPIARAIGLIDRPGGRKTHSGNIPLIGGLAMVGGLMVGRIYFHNVFQGFPFFLTSVVLLVLVGALDDRYDLSPAIRLVAQICATLLMIVGADVCAQELGHVFDGGGDLGWFSIPFTVLIVLTAINAFNMFDGSDGVAGVQALVAIPFLALACITTGVTSHLPVLAGLAGSILGFLLFNWPRKRSRNVRAFMGDAGSTMLGFSFAWISIELSQEPINAISPVVVLWIFALPIFDLFRSVIRRVSKRQSPFHADSEHLHHVLKRFGCSSRTVAQLVLLLAAIFAAIGVGGHMNGVPEVWLFSLWLAMGTVFHMVFSGRLVTKRVMSASR